MWMLQKGAHDERHALFTRQKGRALQKYAMADMHAVKHAKRDNAALRREFFIRNDPHDLPP